MIRTEDVCVYLCRPDPVLCIFGHQKVINAPSGIPFPCFGSITPPRIFNLVRVQMPECVNKSRFQQFSELPSFLIREAGVAPVRCWIR